MIQQRSSQKPVGPVPRPASSPPRPTVPRDTVVNPATPLPTVARPTPTPPPLPRREPVSPPVTNPAGPIVGAAALARPRVPARATAITIDASEFLDDTEVDGITRSEPPPFGAPRGYALMVKAMAAGSALVMLAIALLFATGSTKAAARYAAAALPMGQRDGAANTPPQRLGSSVAKTLSAKVGKHTAPASDKPQPPAKPRATARRSAPSPAPLAGAAKKVKGKAKLQPGKKSRRP